MSRRARVRIRILVLDDGDTWETLGEESNAMVFEVTRGEHRRLCEGEQASELLANRVGARVAWLYREAARCAEPARKP